MSGHADVAGWCAVWPLLLLMCRVVYVLSCVVWLLCVLGWAWLFDVLGRVCPDMRVGLVAWIGVADTV